MCLPTVLLFKSVLAYTCSFLVSGGIHRGGWPEGRGSARTLVAGGLPLSDGKRFINMDLQTHILFLFLLYQLIILIIPV